MAAKQALVRFGIFSRVVTFISHDDLVQVISSTFNDVPSAKGPLLIQIKDEEWGGEFVDLRPGQEVPDRSVLSVVVREGVHSCLQKEPLVEQQGCQDIPNQGEGCVKCTDPPLLSAGRQLRLGESAGKMTLKMPDKEKEQPVKFESMDEEQIKSMATKTTCRPLSEYQKRINRAAEEICLKNPGSLQNRQKLLDSAREKIIEEGFQFAKGKSRSKKGLAEDSCKKKRLKLNQDVREQRMKELEEKIKDIDDKIMFKEKRIKAALNMSDFKICDELKDQVINLEQDKRELESEKKHLGVSYRKSKWYYKRKSDSSASSDVSSETTSASESKQYHKRSDNTTSFIDLSESSHTEASSSSQHHLSDSFSSSGSCINHQGVSVNAGSTEAIELDDSDEGSTATVGDQVLDRTNQVEAVSPSTSSVQCVTSSSSTIMLSSTVTSLSSTDVMGDHDSASCSYTPSSDANKVVFQ